MKAQSLKGDNGQNGEDPDLITNAGSDLAEQDQKSYDTVQKIIEGGQMQKLKVDQCKIYLRKHGLRLSGNKDTLIWRIKEHIDIIDGGGESIYPASSFLLNCKGDACMGDVVMFEHNVYEAFNIASRGGSGAPCGTRVVVGRIIKESYGAAKQQHTFTIEVLWSKGEKPLPPLHPLLIKGRNLYRLKTLRQKWEDEGERQKILMEKHTRGGAARLNREARVRKKELHKTQRLNRETGKENRDRNWELEQKKHEESRNKQHNDYSSANRSILRPFPRQHCEENQRPINYIKPFPVQSLMNHNPPSYFQQSHASYKQQSFTTAGYPLVNEQKQTCRYYPRGRCYFGDRCKYLHK
ncbi:zinc finger CCCH domain-containing protein 62 [Dorcoceras hygrometricum]|uniref:Zinc finger CCCH domain-containing protein 62 n=1 Tax=Dorcoceras hygrometricum TaxID=472368 RepID=A0A2Z7A2C0_9LAMI|nr:zinc finger CCCH domain-containing protein 62 [Dorcoceras hygrometricum]